MAKRKHDVLVVMGSQSDAATMKHAREALDRLGVSYTALITSAHRTPRRMVEVISGAKKNGYKVIIAGAGGSAHLPGMSASETVLPVIGVAVLSKSSVLNDSCAIGSMIAMPPGVPLLFAGFGPPGAQNAGLAAARILAVSDPNLARRVRAFIRKQEASVPLVPDFDK